jgi:hypothetical protein
VTASVLTMTSLRRHSDVVNLTPYVDQLRRELAVAAELGGDDARALAERLATPLESAIRLALLSALSAAAEEITGQLAPGAVDLRLRGGDIGFVVTPPPAPHDDDHPASQDPSTGQPEPEPAPETDDGGTSRVTLRLPELLKTRIEDAARREGFSLNAWLVRAVTRALDPGTAGPSDRKRTRWSGQQYSGWVR